MPFKQFSLVDILVLQASCLLVFLVHPYLVLTGIWLLCFAGVVYGPAMSSRGLNESRLRRFPRSRSILIIERWGRLAAQRLVPQSGSSWSGHFICADWIYRSGMALKQ